MGTKSGEDEKHCGCGSQVLCPQRLCDGQGTHSTPSAPHTSPTHFMACMPTSCGSFATTALNPHFPGELHPLPSFLTCQGQWFLACRQADCGSDLAKLPEDTQLQGRPSPSAMLGVTSPSTHGTAPPSKDSKPTPLCVFLAYRIMC